MSLLYSLCIFVVDIPVHCVVVFSSVEDAVCAALSYVDLVRYACIRAGRLNE